MSTKTIIVFSGGQDSTTCLYEAMQTHDEIHCISFDYGQKHKIELDAAKKVIALAKAETSSSARITHEIIELGALFSGDSPLTNPVRDLDTYKSNEPLPKGLQSTFVPGRNAIFFALAAARGYVLFEGHPFSLTVGVSEEDYGGYPDCRQSFVDSLAQTMNLALWENEQALSIRTPLAKLSKKDCVQLMRTLNHQFPSAWRALGHSHTCYEGIQKSNPTTAGCGVCHACVLRHKGFSEAGLTDPILTHA